MESDRATLWIKDRISEQVIEVNQVRRDHDSAVASPFRSPECGRNQQWSDEMATVMEDGLKKLYTPIQSAKKLL